MQESDLDEVLALERESFTEPWTRKMFIGELQGNTFATSLIARAEPGDDSPTGTLIGYIVFWVVFEELHMMNLAVRPELRRQGIATTLVQQALAMAAGKGACMALLEVRASNLAAQTLYERLGFTCKGIRRGYYEHPNEDAVIMIHQKGGDIMLSEDPTTLEWVRKERPEFTALEDTHQRLDNQLRELTQLHTLTPEEEIRKKQIQFEKLATKDKMAEIVRQCKHNRSLSAGRS